MKSEDPVAIVLVLSGPSGAGKSTLVDLYVERHPETCLVVSATTRPRRPSEVHGEDYHFLERDAFEKGIAEGRYLEFAEVHGNFYGTPRDQVEQAVCQGRDVILEIDVQGGEQVKERRPDTVLCFLTPSCQEELLTRLRGRGEDSEEVIARRVKNAAAEYQALRSYEYRIINDQLEDAYRDLRAVVQAQKCALSRQPVDELISDFTRGVDSC
jgi:guanylate kinase